LAADCPPGAIIDEAALLRQGFGGNAEILSAIERLTTDPRMERLWGRRGELRKKNSAGGYLYPARGGSPELTNDERQSRAWAEIFLAAALLVGGRLPAITERELDRDVQPLIEAAARLRDELPHLDNLGIEPSERAVIAGLAEKYERRARLFRGLAHPIVERHRGDPELRGYVTALAREFERLFGQRLHGTVATIASVALGREVREKMVRLVRP
jgi:hypothetical protein